MLTLSDALAAAPNWGMPMSLFSKLSAFVLALGVMLFAGAALACDNCDGGYYGGHEVYSCNNGLYDCRTESSLYQPRCDDGCYRHSGCGDGCYHHSACCEHSYVRGFRDGYETARYEGEDRGFYDGDHHWHDYERWQDHDGGWHDGWRGGDGHWHDRDEHIDGDHHEGDDHHDSDHHDGDGHDQDGHDHDGHDDHHDGDHHDHP
jgi:hypothetical protein